MDNPEWIERLNRELDALLDPGAETALEPVPDELLPLVQLAHRFAEQDPSRSSLRRLALRRRFAASPAPPGRRNGSLLAHPLKALAWLSAGLALVVALLWPLNRTLLDVDLTPVSTGLHTATLLPSTPIAFTPAPQAGSFYAGTQVADYGDPAIDAPGLVGLQFAALPVPAPADAPSAGAARNTSR